MTLSLSRLFILRIIIGSILLTLFAVTGLAQSTDVRFPTAVRASEVVGTVPARDIGDARLTDHFYTFNGLPGDLLITIESKNLNGDFDVFSATDLRPLVKLVVYAESAGSVTKNIYLRKQESLILRVEGRTPNDDEGTYRIRFGGTFVALENRMEPGDNQLDSINTADRSSDKKTSRVSSSGARIEEPVMAVVATPTSERTVAKSSEEAAAKTPARKDTRGRQPSTPSKPPAKSSTPVAAASKKSVPVKNAPKTVETSPPASDAKVTDETAGPARERPTPRRVPPANARGSARTAKPGVTAENGRLIIEVKDGSRLEYLMSTVSRLTVENGEVVIVSDDGYTKRIPLTKILRMSIAP